jgi:hypothetical protein
MKNKYKLYKIVYKIVNLKINHLRACFPLSYNNIINYSKPLVFPKQIIIILSKQIINTCKNLNWIKDMHLKTFYKFLKIITRVMKKRLHSRGSPALLIQVLRYTAQNVQKSLDHKKQQTAFSIDKLDEKKSRQVYTKKDNFVATVIFSPFSKLNLNLSNHEIDFISKKNKVTGNIYETRKNANLYDLFSQLIISKSCKGIKFINKKSSKSLLTFTSCRYLNYNIVKEKCFYGKNCIENDFNHYFTKHIQPLYADSIFPKLPYSRVGIRNNFRRSSLSKICFEASRSNYIKQALMESNVQTSKDLCGALAFGNPIPFGTGYKISIK